MLVVTNINGCSDTTYQDIIVDTLPLPDFGFISACFQQTTYFTDSSSGGGVNIKSWSWDFGDGDTSTLQNPSHYYNASGSYLVTLSIVNTNSCANSITKTVDVYPLPIAGYTSSQTCYKYPTYFSDTSTPVGSISTWDWDFGDGDSSNIQGPWHQYGTSGPYTVTLIISDTNGCYDTVSNIIFVDSLPIAQFTADTVCYGDLTTFTDLSISQGSANDTWQWDFGDGTIDSIQNPQHIYPNAGVFNVMLVVTNINGCSDTTYQDIIVDTLPLPDFGFISACFQQTTYFTDSSSGGGVNIKSWSWDFGDGDTSTLQNPSHYYNASGSYLVTLSIVNTNSCANSITKTVDVYPLPIAGYTSSQTCYKYPTYFSDTSTPVGSISTWDWDFGDGDSSNIQGPWHQYGTSGPYTVTLIISDTNGCYDTVSNIIFVDSLPIAQFTADTVCYGDLTTFTDLSISQGSANDTWQWDFGDGTIDSIQNPQHIYPNAGVFNVMLVVTNINGCSDTTYQDIIVDTLPLPDFSFNVSCFGDTTHFKDLSSGGGANIKSWYWEFGDNNSSKQPNPSHYYNFPGSYIATLTVKNENECTNFITDTIPIHEIPIPDFTHQPIVCINVPVNFNNISTGAKTYQWDFGDGTPINNQFEPNHSFSSIGTYQVKLIAISLYGCKDSIISEISVIDYPDAYFTIQPDTGCAPLQVEFTNLSSGDSIKSYYWDFGNGTTSTLQNPPPLTYAQGINDTTYYVTLNVTNVCGTVSYQDSVKVTPKPVVFIGINLDEGCSPLTIEFTNTDTYGSPYVFYWDFGDGTFDTTTYTYPQPLNHTFKKDPYTDTTYIITLIAENSCGRDSIQDTVTVWPNAAMAFFNTNPTEACVGEPFTFTNYSQGGDLFQWAFGDNSYASTEDAIHSYSAPGTYLVTLLVTNSVDTCAIDIDSIYITVKALPDINFSYNDSVCVYEQVYFQDISPSIITSHFWDFGDGTYSNVQNPSHLFPSAGDYSVILFGFDDLGECSNTILHIVHVISTPSSTFIPSDTADCIPFTITFNNISTNANYYQWDFGDGNSSTLANPNHTYTNSGTFTVSLISSNIDCYDTMSINVEAFSNPISNFGISDTLICDNINPASVYTDNLSTGTGILGYFWDFDNGYTSTYYNDNSTYINHGSYNIQLIVTDLHDCKDTSLVIFNLYPIPQSNVSIDPNAGCEPLEVSFDVNSIYPFPTSYNYYWSFGDGTNSSLQAPIHVYPNDGIYNIELITIIDNSCNDTLVINNGVNVYPKPVADFVPIEQYQSLRDGTFLFQNSTVDGGIYLWDFGDGYFSNDTDPIHRYNNYGIYLVELLASNTFGCYDTISKEIDVFMKGLFIPNAFSPNNPAEGVREFRPVGVGLKDYWIEVYDTWGNKIWESNKLNDGKPAEGWNGFINGKLMPSDVYVWKAWGVFIDDSIWPGKEYKKGEFKRFGTVTLIR
jgi:PKD repeat protein